MRDRLIITVTDVSGTKSYNVHQFIKKFFLIILVSVILIISGSFWLITILQDDVLVVKDEKKKALNVLRHKSEVVLNELKLRKEIEIETLEKKQNALKQQNDIYSTRIQNKINDIEELSSKLDDIEEIIGLKKNDEASLIQRVTLAQLTSAQKMFTLQAIPNGKPLDNISITGSFGYRKHPLTKKKQFHRGIDLKAKYNRKIYATADGVVKYVQIHNVGKSGRAIKIAHNFGFETVYAHLNKTKVKIGDIVKKGQWIGLTGNSGRSTGPHLHYEVSYAGKALNPRDYIKWNLKNYEYIFNTQRRVQWESLVSLINNHHSKMVQR